MKQKIVAMVAMVMVLSFVYVGFACAGGKATPAEAEALVKKAVAFIKANGKEAAFAEFTNKNGKFIDRELYIFVYDFNGKCLAHGLNPKMVGKDLIELTDPDGKQFNRELIEVAKAKGKGWTNFKFTDPVTKKIGEKTAYVEKIEDIVVGSGAYK